MLHANKLYYPHIGGVEEVVRRIAEGTVPMEDMHAEVLVCNEGLRTVREMVNGVEVTRTGSIGRILSEPISPAYLPYLRRRDADIYHFHTPFPLGELGGLMLGRGRKMVASYHSDVLRQKRLVYAYRPVLERFLRRCSAILVASPQLMRSSPALSSLQDRCRLVHYGVDVRRFQVDGIVSCRASELRDRYATGGGLVLFVGRLVYYKGLEYLLEAAGKVDAGFLILGRGPLAKRLRLQAETAGISRRIHFVDWADEAEITAYYHASDMLVLPSTARTEAFGLVLLEAQACGKPVISTELGTGTSYANLDGITGFVVPPGDAGALAAAVNRLLADGALRKEMGSRGKERVEQEFTLEGLVAGTAKIYAEILGEVRG
ncbi:MAG: glycosyltransferase [Actinobacteria bacterium]|nr:glycosyltransferase [Actinomycetota bacterium]